MIVFVLSVHELKDQGEGYVPNCDHENCGEGSCYFNGSCYHVEGD